MFTLLSELVSGVGSSNALNTKKIDRNIEKLLESDGFNKIYTNERYRNLFFANKRIRVPFTKLQTCTEHHSQRKSAEKISVPS